MLASRGVVEMNWPHPRHDFTRRARVASCLEALTDGHRKFAQACTAVAALHGKDPRVARGIAELAELSGGSLQLLKRLRDRFRVRQNVVDAPGSTSTMACRAAYRLSDALHDLYTLHAELESSLTIASVTSHMLADQELRSVCSQLEAQSRRQRDWLQARLAAGRPD